MRKAGYSAAAAVLLAAQTLLGQAQPGGTLRLAIQAEPKTFDPALAADEPSELVRYLTGGVLIRLNRQTQALEPELAVRWRLAKAGTELSLELRRGVTFSDGTPFSAVDVCDTLRRLADPALDSPAGEPFRGPGGGASCVVAGEYSVKLNFGEPMVAAERLLDQVAIQASRSPARERAVLGPFQLAEHKAGAYVRLARNPRYWKKDGKGAPLPYLDGIMLEIQRNRDFEMMRFRRGELDIVNNLDPELFDRLKEQMPGTAMDLGVSLDSEFLWFNQAAAAPVRAHKKAWFRSQGFRRAISETIRRRDLVKVVYRGHATPAVGPVSPANRLWFNAILREPEGSPKASLEHLMHSGYRLSAGILRDGSGNPVEFSIITNAGNRSRERMAAMIQQDLAQIGIRVSLAPMDFPSLIERITKTFDYEACLLGLIQTDLDPMAQTAVWLSSGHQHQWNPNQKTPETEWEAEIDRLMRAQSTQADAVKRKAAFDRVQQIVSEQAPFIYLVNRNALVAASPEVKNLAPAVLRPQTLWNAERLYLSQPRQVSRR